VLQFRAMWTARRLLTFLSFASWCFTTLVSAAPLPLNFQQRAARPAPKLTAKGTNGVVQLVIEPPRASFGDIIVERRSRSTRFIRIARVPFSSERTVQVSESLHGQSGPFFYRARALYSGQKVSAWSAVQRVKGEAEQPPSRSVTPCASDFLASAYSVVAMSRVSLSLPALLVEESLESAALSHSQRMAKLSALTHEGWYKAIVEAGFNGTSVAQNIAAGYASFSDALGAWLESPSHRANFMNSKWNVQGLGCVVDAQGRVWLTHNFGYR
jgi:uncharacterized protein YkwD